MDLTAVSIFVHEAVRRHIRQLPLDVFAPVVLKIVVDRTASGPCASSLLVYHARPPHVHNLPLLVDNI